MDIKSLTISYYNNGFPTMKDHAEWYVAHHLEVVEKIAYDIASHYEGVDSEILNNLIWLHDFDKAIDGELDKPNQALNLLRDNGCSEYFVNMMHEYLVLFEEIKSVGYDKSLLDSVPIEIRIISTADALSHYTNGSNGFLTIWAQKSMPNADLMTLHEGDLRKREKDKRKVCLDQYREYIDTVIFGYNDTREIRVNGSIAQYLTSLGCNK